MNMYKCSCRRRIAVTSTTLAALLASGCMSASLASNTGPRPLGWRWSTAPRQKAQVGDEVRFDFVLQDWRGRFVEPLGLADYCATMIDGRRLEAEPDVHGHFTFTHEFSHVLPGTTFKVTTTAYQQRGGRDFMRVRGEWLHSDSPYEEPDRKIRADSILITIYEAPIQLTIADCREDLDADTGVMRIRRVDGSITSVYVDRPGRPGFTLFGPDADRRYRIHYLPKGNELNPIGTTDVDFIIYDRAGQAHEVSLTIDTP